LQEYEMKKIRTAMIAAASNNAANGSAAVASAETQQSPPVLDEEAISREMEEVREALRWLNDPRTMRDVGMGPEHWRTFRAQAKARLHSSDFRKKLVARRAEITAELEKNGVLKQVAEAATETAKDAADEKEVEHDQAEMEDNPGEVEEAEEEDDEKEDEISEEDLEAL